jgi:hypothetical protein
MIAFHQQVVRFVKPVDVSQNIEQTLSAIETEMRSPLHRSVFGNLKACVRA